jgi:alpha-amylase/alpha-mannosidase (GH57 family)
MPGVAFVLHGHFYQPPRENPWTEVVPREISAGPYHDWNERITAECYRPNGWARILDEAGRVVAIVDNYEHLSFNVGPTLLSWLETQAPETYERILSADRRTGRALA